ncbi:OLC1v1007809C1 [Oldenlandia corymbosa var. corymbosa]|uniref:OLC1v1007809C1 n=1 Tax=Oldenlandia corymbosa var. corymbosa TaxID=529605 RepID=A0AAV1DMI3_OLDCO|nr:OLC1v1007809C1 [Oldenlandia corymbosa var. corymbosa]
MGISVNPLVLHFLCISASVYDVSSLNSEGQTLLSLLRYWDVVPPIPSTWNASHSTPCFWDGVICETDFVVSLNLSDYNFSGQLGHEIGDLKHLRSIRAIASFSLQIGEVGVSSFGLQQAERLNKLTGTIPDCFGNMSKLIMLDLQSNRFHGTIPSSLQKVNTLTFLALSTNQFEGALPSSLCTLENLEDLLLSDNKFTGTIPDFFGNMSKLSVLDLRKNSLRRMITTNFPEGSRLSFLSLSDNQLEGPLPKSLLNCSSFKILNVTSCPTLLPGKLNDLFISLNLINY